jgi:hypothetical protein
MTAPATARTPTAGAARPLAAELEEETEAAAEVPEAAPDEALEADTETPAAAAAVETALCAPERVVGAMPEAATEPVAASPPPEAVRVTDT